MRLLHRAVPPPQSSKPRHSPRQAGPRMSPHEAPPHKSRSHLRPPKAACPRNHDGYMDGEGYEGIEEGELEKDLGELLGTKKAAVPR